MFIFRFLRNFFHNLYVATFKWYTLLLIRKATKAAAKFMVMSGKNPNYVAPPPPAPYSSPLEVSIDESALDRVWMVDSKNRGNIWSVVDGYYVQNPKSHPILKLRDQWEEKLKKAEEKVKAAKEAAQTAVAERTNTTPTLKEILVETDRQRWEEAQKPMATAPKPVIEVGKKAS
jgi:hypothetical protein